MALSPDAHFVQNIT